MKNILIYTVIILLGLASACKQKEVSEVDYFGQTPPGDRAKVFAPGIISLENRFEQAFCYSPDGKHCYTSFKKKNKAFYTIAEQIFTDMGWSADTIPGFMPESGLGLTPYFHPNKKQVYFPSKDSVVTKADIFKSTYINDSWTEPIRCESPINSEASDWHISFSDDSTMYLSSNREGSSDIDIYVLKNVNGQYPKIESLGDIVNSPKSDCNPVVAPDGSFLIFESKREGCFGGYDLYVAFRYSKNIWGKPINLGPSINTKDDEMSASISPDSKYLFFARKDHNKPPTYSDIYWVSMNIVNSLIKINS